MNNINIWATILCLGGVLGIFSLWWLGSAYAVMVLNPRNWFGSVRTFVQQRRAKVSTRDSAKASVMEGLRPDRWFRVLLIATLLLLIGGFIGVFLFLFQLF